MNGLRKSRLVGLKYCLMNGVMVSFMCELGLAVVPSYSNTNPGGGVKLFCIVIKFHNQLTSNE